MKMLVLDKSALRAAPKGSIGELRQESSFLLTDILMHEIATDGLPHRDPITALEKRGVEAQIRSGFSKAMGEAGNLWISQDLAFRYEIQHGRSAKHAPRCSIDGMSPTEVLDLLDEDLTRKCLAYDHRIAKLAAVVHAPEDDDAYQRLRQLREEEVFREIEEEHWSGAAGIKIAQAAKEGFTSEGIRRGLIISPRFLPREDWFAYGVELTSRAYLRWKLWRRGDLSADREKPANPFFDIIYVAYIAIADGVLSADKGLLKMAWACWPKKRGAIFEYSMQQRKVIPFTPQWSA